MPAGTCDPVAIERYMYFSVFANIFPQPCEARITTEHRVGEAFAWTFELHIRLSSAEGGEYVKAAQAWSPKPRPPSPPR
jgi:hypothetical protein